MTGRLAALAVLFVVLLPPLAAAQAAAQPAAAPAAAPAPRRTEARAVLTDVLAQPAFARARRSSWQKDLQERLREWITRQIARALTPVLGQRGLAELLAWLAPLAALIVLSTWLVRVAFRRRTDRPVGIDAGAPAAQPSHMLAAEAVALIRAGRIREGSRAAYRAAIRRLEEDGALKPDPARTPREQLRQLTPSHRRAAPLARMTSAFETMWYGARPAGADEGSRLLGLLGELECLPSDRAK
jgi:hypothetical protein